MIAPVGSDWMDLSLMVIGLLAASSASTASAGTGLFSQFDSLAECLEAIYPVDVDKVLTECKAPLYPEGRREVAGAVQGEGAPS